VNTKVFIHVARFHPQKNQQLLVDAFNQLHKLGYDFVLIILGGGFDKDGKELIKESCNKIHYLGLKNNVSDYLSCADAFCLTSIYEGLPISLLEAISCGVVPICTKVGGIPDVVNSSSIGLLSDDVSSDSYVSILIQYLSGQEEFSREELKCYFNNNFSMRTCALKYLGIFKGSI
jgi:glycosyltransferase involved in cell wall biosynthesis